MTWNLKIEILEKCYYIVLQRYVKFRLHSFSLHHVEKLKEISHFLRKKLWLARKFSLVWKKRDCKSTFFLHNVVVEKITISTINNNWLHTGYETFPFPGYIGKVPVMYWRTCYRPISIWEKYEWHSHTRNVGERGARGE